MPPNQSNDAVDKWLYDKEVTVYGDIPDPILRFEDSEFPDAIIQRLKENYQFPTTIQSITWPVALTGCDLISIAKTGSGKTLAFILPAIVHVMSKPRNPNDRKDKAPAVVVLLPTRELAIQVEEVAKEYCKLMGLSVCCCYGGSARAPQVMALRRGIDICIATPGRLLDFMNNCITSMDSCAFLVLDEADRMLDMGFEPQIRQIVDQITPNRQTLMFSATWPKDVRNMAADFHKNPVHLTVGSLDLAANHNIQQTVELVDEYDKQKRLWQILKEILQVDRTTKILIFVETKRKADLLVVDMRRNGFPALCIHGDKEQREREWVLAEFKASRNNILVATDVAARGLDVDDIKFVVNFDYPNNSEDYVHRIGRTGRRDKTGTAITFFSPFNSPKARDLIKVLEEAKQNVPPALVDLANSAGENGYDSRSRGRPYGRGGGGGGGSSYYSGSSFVPTGANRISFNSGGGGSGNFRGGGGGGGGGANSYRGGSGSYGGGGNTFGGGAGRGNYGGGGGGGAASRNNYGGGSIVGGGSNNNYRAGGGGGSGGFGSSGRGRASTRGGGSGWDNGGGSYSSGWAN